MVLFLHALLVVLFLHTLLVVLFIYTYLTSGPVLTYSTGGPVLTYSTSVFFSYMRMYLASSPVLMCTTTSGLALMHYY